MALSFKHLIVFIVIMMFESDICYSEGSDVSVCSKFHFEEKVLEKLVRIEHQMELQKQDMAAWEQKMEAKLNSLESLERELKATEKGFEAVMAENKSKLKTLINETQDEVRTTIPSIMQEEIDKMRKKAEDLERPTVAFKARSVDKSTLFKDSVIRFVAEVLNVGGAYDSATGYFTAPVNGTYLFTVQVCTVPKEWFNVLIMAHGKQVGTASHQDNHVTGSCSSGHAIAVLRTGEKAWIEQHSTSSDAAYEDATKWNSFSGILISS